MPKVTQFRAPPKLCVYCGEASASTKDHVPPRSIFMEPLPGQLVTVPACEVCNSGFSELDASFKEWLAFALGVSNTPGKHYWDKKLLPTLDGNQRRKREIAASIRPARSGGARSEPVELYELDIDANIQARMIARLIRGLWFKEFKEIIPPDVPIAQMRLPDFKGLEEFLVDRRWRHFDNQFSYTLGRDPEHAWTSCWFLLFHGGNATMAVTGEASSHADD